MKKVMFVLLACVLIAAGVAGALTGCKPCTEKSPLAGRMFVQYDEKGEISEIMAFGEDGQFVAGAWLVGGGKYELGRADNGKDTIKLVNARTGEDMTADMWFMEYDAEKDELCEFERRNGERNLFTELK